MSGADQMHPKAIGPAHARLGAELKRLRVAAGRTQRDMDTVVGRGHVSDVENGKAHSSDTLVQQWLEVCVPAGEGRALAQRTINSLKFTADAELDDVRRARQTMRRPTVVEQQPSVLVDYEPAAASMLDESGTSAVVRLAIAHVGSEPPQVDDIAVEATIVRDFQGEAWRWTETKLRVTVARGTPAGPIIFAVDPPAGLERSWPGAPDIEYGFPWMDASEIGMPVEPKTIKVTHWVDRHIVPPFEITFFHRPVLCHNTTAALHLDCSRMLRSPTCRVRLTFATADAREPYDGASPHSQRAPSRPIDARLKAIGPDEDVSDASFIYAWDPASGMFLAGE